MYGLSDRLKPLSAAEEQVLLALWDCTAPVTRRDISEKLTATGWAYCVAAMRQRMDTLFGGSLPEAVRALASESGASQSQLEQAIRVLEEQHQEAEEYDLYDPYG